MSNYPKYLPVNWVDGMKINKNHFIAQDNAWNDALKDIGYISTSPLRFGILPAIANDENNFNVSVSLDNQNTVRVSVLSCNAITPGGCRISIAPGLKERFNGYPDGVPATTFSFPESRNDTNWWIVLLVNPFAKTPTGNPDLSENPLRHPFVAPTYHVQLVDDNEYDQYAYHPYAIVIGKIYVSGPNAKVDSDFIPPCYAISASPDLVNLHAELDQFMSRLEMLSSQIVQKIYQRNQQNDISMLVMFLCDRIISFLGPAITDMRWKMLHESPATLLASVTSLARVMKNAIDLRIGSGKEEMINYLTDWCELKQGELESMLSGLAMLRFDNNDVNKNIQRIIPFIKTISKLFETLNNLDFIGKRRETGIFVKEETVIGQARYEQQEVKATPRRRFLG